MRKILFSITVLLALVISGCSPAQISTTPSLVSPTATVSSTAPTLKCRNYACVRAVMATTGNGQLAVRFVITNQNGKVDAINPPRFEDDNLSFELFRVEPDGTMKSILKSQRSGRDFDCFASDRFQEFDGQLIGVCGFLVPSTTAAGGVQAGDKLKVSLKEFEFEQVITVNKEITSNTPRKNNATSITDAFFMLPNGSSVTTAAFPQEQAVIRLIVVVANAAAGTKVKLALTAVDVGDVAPPNSAIDEIEQSASGNESLIFTMTPPPSGIRPKGKYKADIYLDSKLDRTLEFSVK